ncbi:hypothetical protein [Roseicitreum antarcticum]|uniref:Uncharacterized protein n=1 Tax=Roseicitreum antarcticum TaxID=564137 RepID=A0A1H3GDU8_9RHOB|nr:hypothetical protein [Roseicitreum antarcticum]SDY00674.1 hypothetical protein SAMN04488238_1762 [Roseicitreum antarcticum]
MTPDTLTDALARAQDTITAFESACRKILPLIEAASREEVTDVADWDEAEDMIRAAMDHKGVNHEATA